MENIALVTINVPRYTASSRPTSSSSSSSSDSSSSNSSSSSGSNKSSSNSSNSSISSALLALQPVSLPAMPGLLPSMMPQMGDANLTRSGPPPTTDDVSLGVKFVSAGTAACIADLVTFPLDTAKVRLQIQGESMAARLAAAASASGVKLGTASAAAVSPPKGLLSTMLTISRTEGARALYSGLAPGLQRQMCFASVRIGLYDSVKQGYSNMLDVDVNQKNIPLRILAGITTGGAAVLVAQPTDVVKVRMQAQGRQVSGAPRYSSSMMAYRTIALKEGTRGLWKGTLPNVSRNAIVNCTELVSYDLIKEALVTRQILSDGIPCHFVSAVGAGFFTTLFASPVDVLKTRFMNSAPGVYSSVGQLARSMYQEGGVTTFYKGCVPAFLRFGPWNVVMFISYEQLKKHFSCKASAENSNGNNSTGLLFPKLPGLDIKSSPSRFA